jgi:SAM-dependent methyltransferase
MGEIESCMKGLQMPVDHYDHYVRIAELYDSFVKTDVDVPFFLSEAQKAGDEILELMVGTGRLTIPLLEAGIPITCVDFSAEMLAILREKLTERGLNADVHQADVCNFDLGRQFKQIILPFQAFPEITEEADQRRALHAIHKHLQPDGEFICTLHNPAVRLKSVDDQLHLVGRHEREHGGHLLVWLLQKHDPSTNLVEVLEFFEEYDGRGMLLSKRYSALQFHLLDKPTFERLIAEAGFVVQQLYGDYHYAPFDEDSSPFMVWVLRGK